MSTYLVAKRECVDWDLPVFSVGTQGKEEAIAVFTSHPRASGFLRERRLEHDHLPGEVAACEFIEVLLTAFEQGVDYIWINPTLGDGGGSDSRRLLPVRLEVAKFARELARKILASN